MVAPLEFRPPLPELTRELAITMDRALDRLRASPALSHLADLVPSTADHHLYEVEAAGVREVPAEEVLPGSLLLVVVQFVLPLARDETDLFPENVSVGPNLLGPDAPIQGLLAPVVVRGQDSRGRPVEVPGALIVPGFVGLPIRISRVPGVSEVVVYVGSRSIVGTFHDRHRDVLVFDLLGQIS